MASAVSIVRLAGTSLAAWLLWVGPAGASPIWAVAVSADSARAQAKAANSATGGFTVRVFFSKRPDSFNNFAAVFPVLRRSPTLGVATFAISQLIAGPTANEARAGYFTELARFARNPSNCGPMGFGITLDHRGNRFDPDTATLKLCRFSGSGGIGTDARIKHVAIMRASGACLGDLSGMNVCLRPGNG